MSNMAVQMNYGEPSRGMPGLLYDRANYDAVTRRNSAEDGKLFFGCGVVQGAEPGKDITLPATGATTEKFEGVVMYSANTEMDDEESTMPWESGTTEGVQGHSDGCRGNLTNGKYPYRVAGIEMQIGAYTEQLDPLWKASIVDDDHWHYDVFSCKSGEKQVGSIAA